MLVLPLRISLVFACWWSLVGQGMVAVEAIVIPPHYPNNLDRSALVGLNDPQQNGPVADGVAYPYLLRLLDQSSRAVCAGTLVANDVVLTAGHCLNPFLQAVVVETDEPLPVPDNEPRTVTQLLSHPFLDGDTFRYDYLLLKLNKPFRTISPVLLNLETNYNDPVKAAGVGVSLLRSPPFFLQDLSLETVASDQCVRDYEGVTTIDPDVMICAEVPDGQADYCQGDSGESRTWKLARIPTRPAHQPRFVRFCNLQVVLSWMHRAVKWELLASPQVVDVDSTPGCFLGCRQSRNGYSGPSAPSWLPRRDPVGVHLGKC